MIKCTEIYEKCSGMFIKSNKQILINENFTKYIKLIDNKFNDKNIYRIRFQDSECLFVISEELDKQFKPD